MKIFFLTGTVLFFVVALILAFENMSLSCNNFLFVFFPMPSPFLMVVSITALGFLIGVFFTALLVSILANKAEDEEAPGGNW